MAHASNATNFAARRDREARRSRAKRPKKISDVLAQLITKKGYGRTEANRALDDAWRSAAGEALARLSRPGRLRGGRLEVVVISSTTVQELSFQKRRILADLGRLAPDARIRDLRFRVGPIA